MVIWYIINCTKYIITFITLVYSTTPTVKCVNYKLHYNINRKKEENNPHVDENKKTYTLFPAIAAFNSLPTELHFVAIKKNPHMILSLIKSILNFNYLDLWYYY